MGACSVHAFFFSDFARIFISLCGGAPFRIFGVNIKSVSAYLRSRIARGRRHDVAADCSGRHPLLVQESSRLDVMLQNEVHH